MQWSDIPSIPLRAVALGSVLGFDEPALSACAHACARPVFSLRDALLIQEDHGFTFVTCSQPYRRENDHLPYGPAARGCAT